MTINEFITVTLANILKDKATVNVVLTTYNSVLGHRKGVFKIGGLHLDICSALTEEDQIQDALKLTALFPQESPEFKDEFNRQVNKCKEDQTAINVSLFNRPDPDLVVVYAGVSAFNEALRTIALARIKWPTTYLVALTCDCNLADKKETFSKLIKSDVLKTYIVSPICGGHSEMGSIANHLIRHFRK